MDVVGGVITSHFILHDISTGCMSSGGFSVSSRKSQSVIDKIHKSEVSNKKDPYSDIPKSFQKSEAKIDPLTYPGLKYPGFASADHLHQYARNCVMVQR